MRKLTIICPVHNEEVVVPLFFGRIRPVIEELSQRYAVDLLFINNASTDGTLEEIRKLRTQFPFIYVITLSANVGYQRSLECGLRHAKGDLFVFIDVDCEDPPEMILDFVAKHEEGFDIVYGERIDREEARAVNLMRKLFYRMLRAVSDEDIILDMAEFSLFTAEVRDAIIKEKTSFPFIRSSISRVGFRRSGIAFKRHRRIAGQGHYNFVGMFIFAVAGILASSTLMLRLPIYLLPLWLIGLLGLGVGYTISGEPWLAVAAALLFSAYVGITLAFIALYVGRTYRNTLQRPNYTIYRRYSFVQPDECDSRD